MSVPDSYKSKCPVEAFVSFKDDPQMVEKFETTHKDHKARKTNVSAHAKEVI